MITLRSARNGAIGCCLVFTRIASAQVSAAEQKLVSDFVTAVRAKVDSTSSATAFRYDPGHEWAGKFGRSVCEFSELSYDVQKTSSIVAPYTAPISFHLATGANGPFEDSASARSATASAKFWVKVRMIFAWSSERWRYVSGTAQFLPNTATEKFLFKGGAEVPLWPTSFDDDGGLSVVYANCLKRAAWALLP